MEIAVKIHKIQWRVFWLGAVQVALLLSTGCGGGGTTGGAEVVQLEVVHETSAGVPGNLLPLPGNLRFVVGNDPPEACLGSGFEGELPSHRVTRRGNTALFEPQSGNGGGKGNGNGRYAYAIYRLIAPEGTSDKDNVALKLRVNPLHEESGKSGENPLYSGLANWEDNQWDWEEHTVSFEDSRCILRSASAAHQPLSSLLLAVVVAPSSAGGGAGTGGSTGGGLVVEQVCSTSGWEVEIIDQGVFKGPLNGMRQLDADWQPDGNHGVCVFTGEAGLRYYNKRKFEEEMQRVSDTSGSGPNVSLATSPEGVPHIYIWDSRSELGLARWSDDLESPWHKGIYADGGVHGEPFDNQRGMDAVFDSSGVAHVLFNDAVSRTLYHAWSGNGIDWKQQVVAEEVDLAGPPAAVISEKDELACVFRTSSSVQVSKVTVRGWDPAKRVADVQSPSEPDGTLRGLTVADLDRDGRLDIVCNSPQGDVLIQYMLDGSRTHINWLHRPVSSSSQVAVSSSSSPGLTFEFHSTGSDMRCARIPAWGDEDWTSVVGRLAETGSGPVERVVALDAVLDPDDDGDGLGDASCYVLVLTPSVTEPGVYHWTLEVRVNRIEMA